MGMAGSACAVTGSVWRPDESATDGRISTRRPAVPRLLPASRPLRRSRPPVLPRFQTWDGVCRTSCPTPTKGDARVPADLDSFLLGTDEQERRCSFATNGAVCDHALRPSLHCCYGRGASVPAGERLTLASSERSGSTGCGERDAWTSSEATVGSGSSGATASASKAVGALLGRCGRSGLRAALRRKEASALEVHAFGLPSSVIGAAARAGSAPRPAVDSNRVPFGAAATVATDPAVRGVSGLLGHGCPPTVGRHDATPGLMGSQQGQQHPGTTRHAATRRALRRESSSRQAPGGHHSFRLEAGALPRPACAAP